MDTGAAALLLVVILLILLVVIAAWRARQQDREEQTLKGARTAYRDALTALKARPTDPDLRERTLALGRAYANLTRDMQGVTVYDEMAVMNDINAATAGAGAATAAPAASPEERLKRLDELRAKGVITEEEFAQRRQKILDEL